MVLETLAGRMVAMAAGEPAAMADTPDVRSRHENVSVSEHSSPSLKRAQAAARNALDADLGRIGLTIPQFLALAHVAENADVSGAELARMCSVTPQASSRSSAPLRTAGLVRRVPAAGGGRSLTMRLTDKGAELVKNGVRARLRDRALHPRHPRADAYEASIARSTASRMRSPKSRSWSRRRHGTATSMTVLRRCNARQDPTDV